MKKIRILVFILLGLTLLAGCSLFKKENDNDKQREDVLNLEVIHNYLVDEEYYLDDLETFYSDVDGGYLYSVIKFAGFTGSELDLLNSIFKLGNPGSIYLEYIESAEEVTVEEFLSELMLVVFNKELKVKVTFSGLGKEVIEEVAYFSSVEIPASEFTYDEADYQWVSSNKVWDFTNRVVEDIRIDLEAITYLEYNITYHLNKGTNSSYNITKYTSKTEFELFSPTRLGYTFMGWFTSQEFSGEVVEAIEGFVGDLELYAKWDYEVFNMAILNIELETSSLAGVGKEDYERAVVSIFNTEEEYILDELPAGFRGRGHGSWTFPKKGYRIKFDKKQSVFGEAKSKHWVIVPGGHDDSLMRHSMAYTLVNENLDGIEYTTSVNYVEVYVNGEYQGIYSLFEHVRVDSDRVDIESSFGVIDTGYLLEYDSYILDEGIEEGLDYFKVNGLRYGFEVKSPDPDDYLEEVTKAEYKAQIAFIKDYMQSVVDAALNEDFNTFTELVDINSFVDMYIIHEFMKNTDTGWSSFYLYKKAGGKLFAGPAWDFDLSSGKSRGDSSASGIYVGDKAKDVSDFTSSEIYIALMKQPEFVSLVKSRLLEVLDGFDATIDQMFTEREDYLDSINRDAIRWDLRNGATIEAGDKLKVWTKARITWLRTWANS